jgi:hypothetical protein
MVDGIKLSHPIPLDVDRTGAATLHQYSIVSASLYLMDTVLKYFRHDLMVKGWQEYICHISDTHKKARLLFENDQQDLLDLMLTENQNGSTGIHISVKLKGAANRVVINFQRGEMFYDESA